MYYNSSSSSLTNYKVSIANVRVVLTGLDAAMFPRWVRELGLWQIVCAVNAPVMAVKAGISLVHLVAAARQMVDIDVHDRELARASTSTTKSTEGSSKGKDGKEGKDSKEEKKKGQ